MNIDINKIEDILLRAQRSCSDEATKTDIEQFLEQLKLAHNLGNQMPQKVRSLVDDIVIWISAGKSVVDLITLLWIHQR
ncbi:hypothetical protein LLH06_00120 [Mucilaginibacter daejeonensis]|uniref:hypothetical protein n=1 Tax=Mucilaginibacter daejeonensis TaxID=398049 RepID=UPI001D16FD0C|nr:hypothetical protein [Mucilaginibacter daejeonensis]UEG53385.1 hypothetical protein LLH06_00120 [Mucilaginibacter daejeonensis]